MKKIFFAVAFLFFVITTASAQFDYITFSMSYSGSSSGPWNNTAGTGLAFGTGFIKIRAEVHKTGAGSGGTGGVNEGMKLIVRKKGTSYDPDYDQAHQGCKANQWLSFANSNTVNGIPVYGGTVTSQTTGTNQPATLPQGITMNYTGSNGNNDVFEAIMDFSVFNAANVDRYSVELRADDYDATPAYLNSANYAGCNTPVSGQNRLGYFTAGSANVFRTLVITDSKTGAASAEYYDVNVLEPGSLPLSGWNLTGAGAAGSLCQNDPLKLGIEENTFKNTTLGGNVNTPKLLFWLTGPGGAINNVGSAASPIVANIPFRSNCNAGSNTLYGPFYTNGGSCQWQAGTLDNIQDQSWQISPDNAGATAAAIYTGSGPAIPVTGGLIDLKQMILNANGGVFPPGAWTLNFATSNTYSGSNNLGTQVSATTTKTFTIGTATGCTILPISLTAFTVNKSSGGALLHWSTNWESNGHGFDIQTSSNGTSWQTIGFLKATNTNSIANYSFTHAAVINGLVYYRLKLTDIDGKFIYSLIRTLNLLNGSVKITLSPNPVSNSLLIEGNTAALKSITLINAGGAKILVYKNVLPGAKIDVSHLTTGLYMVKIEDVNGAITTQKVIKK